MKNKRRKLKVKNKEHTIEEATLALERELSNLTKQAYKDHISEINEDRVTLKNRLEIVEPIIKIKV